MTGQRKSTRGGCGPCFYFNDDIMGTTTKVQSDVSTIPLGNAVQEVGEWTQSINALVYEAKSEYFVDQLNRMWMREQPPVPIKVVDNDH
jgi:hypothetical protein